MTLIEKWQDWDGSLLNGWRSAARSERLRKQQNVAE